MLRKLLLLVAMNMLSPFVLATVSGFIQEQNRTEVWQKINEAESSCGALSFREGEIIGIESEPGSTRVSLIVLLESKKREVYLLEGAQVYINGRLGSSEALKPVAPGYNFSVALYFDRQGKLRIVDAWYLGGEAKLLSITECMDGWRLQVVGIETGEIRGLAVETELFSSLERLKVGESYYFLLGIDGKVRCISEEE